MKKKTSTNGYKWSESGERGAIRHQLRINGKLAGYVCKSPANFIVLVGNVKHEWVWGLYYSDGRPRRIEGDFATLIEAKRELILCAEKEPKVWQSERVRA